MSMVTLLKIRSYIIGIRLEGKGSLPTWPR